MRLSLILTVLNEEKTVSNLVDSILRQTLRPSEIIVVDGGSKDSTVTKLKKYKKNIKFSVKQGNRSVGRNAAIAIANGDIILCTDAGCVLDKNWVKNITTPLENEKVDVVAGYYMGLTKTIFQKCLIPYVLVMPDKLDPSNFLPSSRSMAFRKSAWQRAGGFLEELSHNEDFVFAKKLKFMGANIVFNKYAIVYWIPSPNLKEAFIMFYRFARGDIEAHILRPKVAFLFIRYLLLILLSVYLVNDPVLLILLISVGLLYCIWSISKNYKYVKDLRAFFILPLIQFTADFAIIIGSVRGIIK